MENHRELHWISDPLPQEVCLGHISWNHFGTFEPLQITSFRQFCCWNLSIVVWHITLNVHVTLFFFHYNFERINGKEVLRDENVCCTRWYIQEETAWETQLRRLVHLPLSLSFSLLLSGSPLFGLTSPPSPSHHHWPHHHGKSGHSVPNVAHVYRPLNFIITLP